MLKEAELFCEAGLPGMLFSIVGVSVFVPFSQRVQEAMSNMLGHLSQQKSIVRGSSGH